MLEICLYFYILTLSVLRWLICDFNTDSLTKGNALYTSSIENQSAVTQSYLCVSHRYDRDCLLTIGTAVKHDKGLSRLHPSVYKRNLQTHFELRVKVNDRGARGGGGMNGLKTKRA